MRFLLALGLVAGSLCASEPEPSAAQIQEIITKFSTKETEFAKARENYTYRQTARVIELDAGGNPGGRWEMVSDIIFTGEGKRSEHVVRAPVATLQNIQISPEDEQDLRSVQPFVLTAGDISKYDVRYVGKEKLDEINCYQFAVKPKTMEKGKRYFEGQVWVDDHDLQIVKSYGRGVGILSKHSDQAFAKFETYREQIDGKYWFPTYTIANDTLNFKTGQSQRIKMTVKYEDYKQFKSDTLIKYGDEVNQTPTVPPSPKKP